MTIPTNPQYPTLQRPPFDWGPPQLPPQYQQPKEQKHRLRNLFFGFVALVVTIIVIAAIVNGGSGSGNSAGVPNANTATHASKVDADQATVRSGRGHALPITNGDWRLISVSVEDDGTGNFGGVGRVVYTGSHAAGGSNDFTVTVFKSGKVVATLLGGVASVQPGGTGTVQFIGTEKLVAGPFTYDFQKDF